MGSETRICVTSQGEDLESTVDPRFGRCQYFIFVDTGTMEFESIRNPNIDGMGGVGVQNGQFVAGKNVKAILTGNVGPNAFQTLQAAGIDIITGVSGTVRAAIDKFKNGEYKPAQSHSVGSKFGMPPKNQ